ncbi:MAG: polyisoprenoid-binding protein YceI [Gammaproteobacteria bacterium]|jgi:polyisoprenoid-binding protein YceI
MLQGIDVMNLQRCMDRRTRGWSWTVSWLWVVLLFASPATMAEPKRYVIDAEHVTVAFLVEHIGFAKVLGRFLSVSGEYTFDEASGVLSDVRIEVQTDSVSTDHERRDRHLRGADFLNVDEHSMMTYTAASANVKTDRTYTINGELELLGVKRPVQLTARWNKSGTYPFGGNPYVMGVSARGSFKRSDFGMTYAVGNALVGDAVELILEFEARPQ